MIAKHEQDIDGLREGGKRLGVILRTLAEAVHPGVTTRELDDLATTLIRKGGDEPAFLNYSPRGAKRPYPAALCTSVNNEVVHGIPNEEPRTLQKGDIIALDLGLIHNGLVLDAAITVPAGTIDGVAKRLITTTKEALDAGIQAARVGNTIGDIGFAIEEVIQKGGFTAANELGGHGVGKKVHEEPYVPNWGKRGAGEKIVDGMVLALEPIVNEGTANIMIGRDGYTIATRDGKRSAHFEHTILITEKGAEILTK